MNIVLATVGGAAVYDYIRGKNYTSEGVIKGLVLGGLGAIIINRMINRPINKTDFPGKYDGSFLI